MRTFPLALAFSAIFVSGACAQEALVFCSDSPPSDRGLYVFENGVKKCWSAIRNKTGLYEGIEYVGDVPKLTPRRKAKFAYLIAAPSKYRSAVVIKEREFKPIAVFGSDGKWTKAKERVSQRVVLDRPPIQNSCNNKDDLDNFASRRRRGDKVQVDVNSYNRYHAQTGNFIRATDDIREFHYSYERGGQCIGTNDPTFGNRSQYVLERMTVEPNSLISLSWITPAYAENNYYRKLRVRNAVADGSEPIQRNGWEFQVIRFDTDPVAATRTELTISDLENRSGGAHNPFTWHVEWNN